MTPQEIFNTAYTGIIAQGRQSVSKNGECRYRGPDGLKCAVGFMIDDATAQEWEGVGIMSVNRFRTPPDWIVNNIDLLIMIQDAHDREVDDDADFIEEFTARMQNLAQHYNLEIPA